MDLQQLGPDQYGSFGADADTNTGEQKIPISDKSSSTVTGLRVGVRVWDGH